MSVCKCIVQDRAHLTQVLSRLPLCIWNTGCCSAHHFEESPFHKVWPTAPVQLKTARTTTATSAVRLQLPDIYTGLRGNHESMLKVFLFLMCTLSLILLSLHLLALSTTPAAFQSILWFVFIQWTAFTFLTSPVLPALLCSVILVFNGLPVSPTYTSSHCAQGIWYTTPLSTCFCGPFTLVSRLLNVLLC